MRCGNVFGFTLNVPSDTSFDDAFTLTIPYCNGFSADDIYTYNDNTGEWKKQNGEFDYTEFTITMYPSALSTHGVFALALDDDDKKGTSENETENQDDDDSELEVTVEDGDDEEDDGVVVTTSGNHLPSTATNVFNYLLIGAALLVAGFGFIFFKRRMAQK